jgi:hypothetical protein
MDVATGIVNRNGSTGSVAMDTALARKSSMADNEMAAARRKMDAAIELMMSFEPSAEQLTEAARAIVKIAHKGMRGE